MRNGFEFGLSSLPPEIRSKIQVTSEDSLGLPTKAILSLKSLLAKGRLDIVINANAPSANAIASTVDREKITLFSISADKKVLKDRPSIFLFFSIPEQIAPLLVKHAEQRGYKKLALISALSDGRMYVHSELERAAVGLVDFVFQMEVKADERDFRSVIAKLRQTKGLDAVVYNLYVGQNGNFAQQVQRSGLKLPLIGTELVGIADERKAANGALNGSFYSTGYQGSKDLLAAFLRQYPCSSTFSAVNGYDIALIIGQIVARNISKEKIPQFLHSKKGFNGALGQYQLGDDNRFNMPGEICTVSPNE